MAGETEVSESSIIDSLKAIIPDDGYNMGQQEEPKEEEGATVRQPEKEPVKEPEKEEGGAPNKQQEGNDAQQAKQEEDVEIEIDGERYKVPAKLRDGIMMHADYTRKTMELAEQRKALEANKPNPQEIEQYKTRLTKYEQLLGQSITADQNTDWVKLLKEDPIGYLEKKELADARAREWQQVQTKQETENAERTRQTLAHEAQQLIAKRPEWKDVAVWKADVEKMKPSLLQAGYTEQDIGSISDHRAYIIADKARRFDELMSAKADTIKKIEKLPPKIERPGVASEENGQANKAAMIRLQKSGSIDDAAAVIRSLM